MTEDREALTVASGVSGDVHDISLPEGLPAELGNSSAVLIVFMAGLTFNLATGVLRLDRKVIKNEVKYISAEESNNGRA